MSDANKALVRRLYAEINAGRLDAIDSSLADDFIEHDRFPGLEPSREGVRKLFEAMRAAFPDLRMEVDDMIAEGDKVFVRLRVLGTHKGEFMGMAPTGRRIEVPLADFMRIQSGRLAEHWGVTDNGAMMQQLGQGGSGPQ